MSRNGSGTMLINSAGQPVVSNTTITSTAFNTLTADLALALTQSICIDGQTPTTGVIPFAAGLSLFGGTTLTSYREGSWTPVLVGWTNVGSPTIAGTYTRIGRLVFITLVITPATSISATAAASTVTGLPYTVSTATAAYSADGASGAGTASGGLFNAGGTTLFVGTTGVVSSQQIWSGCYTTAAAP